MQAKLGAGFLIVALCYLLVGIALQRLGLSPMAEITLAASSYVVLGLATAWVISALQNRRLRQLARAANWIAKGDLTIELDTRGKDETAGLARSLSVMTASLRNVVLEVENTAERINSSAQSLSTAAGDINAATEEIAGTARGIASGAEHQAAQVLRTTRTTRTLSEAVARVAERAHTFYGSAAASADGAARFAADARRAADAITQLTERTASATAAMDGFRRKAADIGNIVSSITSISHQTHLLAINAAIEAARAGEEGRGFAVVAEEVSGLADNVRRFAEQISSISDEILEGTHAVGEEIRRSDVVTDELREMVKRGAESFGDIVTAARGTASHVGEISDLTDKQKVAADEVTRGLEAISEIAESNVRGTEEASSATDEQTASTQRMVESSRDLAGTSDQLRELISIFRLH